MAGRDAKQCCCDPSAVIQAEGASSVITSTVLAVVFWAVGILVGVGFTGCSGVSVGVINRDSSDSGIARVSMLVQYVCCNTIHEILTSMLDRALRDTTEHVNWKRHCQARVLLAEKHVRLKGAVFALLDQSLAGDSLDLFGTLFRLRVA